MCLAKATHLLPPPSPVTHNRSTLKHRTTSRRGLTPAGAVPVPFPPPATENALDSNEETACTSGLAQFWDPRTGNWRSTFETLDSESHDIDMFYLNQVDGMNELWATEIESWMAPSLYNQLQYNYVKLNITCPEENVVTDSCVIFKPT